MTSIRKVVIPVAGLGTRVLPATKSTPKEMLTVVDRPLIDYVVREAHDAGIEHVILVTGRGKGAIEDYFDHAFELEATLDAKNKTAMLEEIVGALPAAGAISYTRQQAPLGLGHAVWCARELVGNEPFAVSLPDEIVATKPGFLKQLVDAYDKVGGSLVSVEDVPRAETKKYGVVDAGERNGNLVSMRGMVEKPEPEAAPSTLRIIGRYILQPDIFSLLENQERGAGGEIQLTDAMNRMAADKPFHAVLCEGEIHDCGSKLGWLQANVKLGLANPALGPDLRSYIEKQL